jgi:serine/threonine protein kinase
MSEKNEHSIDDYEILSQIGRGTFGDIFLVREVAIGKVFAMKVVKKKKIVKKKLI